MKKADVTVVLWFQIFRALIAIFLIVWAITYCTKNTNVYDENFKKAEELIKSVYGKEKNYKVSDLFVFEPENQMGVFFRGDQEYNYVAQYVKSCWEETVYLLNIPSKNPETNCIKSSPNKIYMIERPNSCGIGGCFCILTGFSVDIHSKELPEELKSVFADFTDEEVSKYNEIKYDTIRCKNIDYPPAKLQIINDTEEVEVEIYSRTPGAVDVVKMLEVRNVTQEIINIGGTFMTPISNEAFLFYFSQRPEEDGFVVCKFEDQC